MRADIVPGAVFPDYELPDHRGKHRTEAKRRCWPNRTDQLSRKMEKS